jgi:hypothetical protein
MKAMIDSKTKYPDDIIREFTLEVLRLKQRGIDIEREISVKQAFLKNIKQKQTVKYSELYYDLENDTNTYWRVKKVFLDCRKTSFYEIKVLKKYFFNTAQLAIMQTHFEKKYIRTHHDIRISQFY